MSETEDYDRAGTLGAHKTTHEDAGSDQINVAGLSGRLADDQHVLDSEVKLIKLDGFATPDDNTNLNASASRHGLLKKLSNIVTEFLNGKGGWSVPFGAAHNHDSDTLQLDGINSDAGAFSFITAGLVTFSDHISIKGNISFPATAVQSVDPNTLDDYEEGTWSPEYIPLTGDPFTSITYGFRYASYTKIARLVTINCHLRTSALDKGSSTAGANIAISGLPFTPIDSNDVQYATGVGVASAFLTEPPIVVNVKKNVSNLPLKKDLSFGNCTVASLDTGGADNFISFSLSYISP